ncbi:hypothetical protein [Streptomyces sp. NPDC048521]|uniref:hypothetical protein n=1 Tax=Streptomyces sp. NPDC048521 TaxID=3365566 RepID=UPI0037214A9F
MGERLSGGGGPGRPPVHPGGAVSDPEDVHDTATLETVLAAALRGHDLDPEAEQRALAAFRTARGTGAHRARTRRRDDWRPPAERRARRPARLTFGVVLAGLTLGGVAVAAIGSTGSSTDGAGAGTGRVSARPSVAATHQASSGGPGATGGPSPARDTEAHCRAYRQAEDRGKALDSRTVQQLVVAAHGRDRVGAYCSEQLARATATPGRPTGRANPDEGSAATGTGNGTAGDPGSSGAHTSSAGTTGSGASGADAGGADNAAGNGEARGDKDGGKRR